MIERGGGVIVNVASVAAERGAAGRAPYATTKHAVVGLTRSAGVEWAPLGVRVNAVGPGYVDAGVLSAAIAAGSARSGAGARADPRRPARRPGRDRRDGQLPRLARRGVRERPGLLHRRRLPRRLRRPRAAMSARVRAVRAGTATLPLPAPLRLGPVVVTEREYAASRSRPRTASSARRTALPATRPSRPASSGSWRRSSIGREADPEALWDACSRATVDDRAHGARRAGDRARRHRALGRRRPGGGAAPLAPARRRRPRVAPGLLVAAYPLADRTPESLAEDVIRYGARRLDAPQGRARSRPGPHAPLARDGRRRAPRRRAARRRRGLRLALERGGARGAPALGRDAARLARGSARPRGRRGLRGDPPRRAAIPSASATR